MIQSNFHFNISPSKKYVFERAALRPFAIFLALIHGMMRTIADLRNIHIKTISYFILLHLPQKHPLFLAILGNQVIEVRSQKAHVLGIRWILLTLTFTKQSILVSTDSSEVDFQRAGKYLCWLQVIVNIVLAIAKTTLWQFFQLLLIRVTYCTKFRLQ